jgi:hypothetical protein
MRSTTRRKCEQPPASDAERFLTPGSNQPTKRNRETPGSSVRRADSRRTSRGGSARAQMMTVGRGRGIRSGRQMARSCSGASGRRRARRASGRGLIISLQRMLRCSRSSWVLYVLVCPYDMALACAVGVRRTGIYAPLVSTGPKPQTCAPLPKHCLCPPPPMLLHVPLHRASHRAITRRVADPVTPPRVLGCGDGAGE